MTHVGDELLLRSLGLFRCLLMSTCYQVEASEFPSCAFQIVEYLSPGEPIIARFLKELLDSLVVLR